MKKIKIIGLTFCAIILALLSIFVFTNNILTTNTNSSLSKNHEEKKKSLIKPKPYIPKELLNHNENLIYSTENNMRKFPYPYKSMLAICSDIDDATLEEFKTYHKFLNTKENTEYGQGLGLDIGDSFWMYMADDMNFKVDTQHHGVDHILTFFKGTNSKEDHNSKEIVHFIKSGWIDSIHSFGDFSTNTEKTTKFNRNLAIDAYTALNNSKLNVSVWINHGNRSNTQNFGAGDLSEFMSYQSGDNKDSKYYHTDLTLKNNIKYLWNSLNDTAFGVDYPLFEINLRDGQKVWGFSRHTNYIKDKKIDWTWTPEHLYRQLTKKNLDSIVEKHQYSIIAQHFGVSAEDLFKEKNIKSLNNLKNYQDDGKILVAKTSRLLNYANVQKHIVFKKIIQNEKTYINVLYVKDPIFGKRIPTLDEIRGLTFYCDNPSKTNIYLNDVLVSKEDVLENTPKNAKEKSSISIKWFEPDYTDYTSSL